jgi:protein-S-isoprenylcysteine O-methyltransferase Ste14
MDFRQRLFKSRSYTPIPFLVMMVIFARPTVSSILAGLPIMMFGEFLRLWGVSIAGSETRTTGPVGGTFLITDGPFAYVRNPLYLGNMLLYFSVGVMSQALFPWLAIGAFLYFLWQYSLIVSLEEEYLARTFGEEYSRYRNTVPRFFPSWNKYPRGMNEQPELNWTRGFVSEKSTLLAIATICIVLGVMTAIRTGG